jgi:hypothetical protein
MKGRIGWKQMQRKAFPREMLPAGRLGKIRGISVGALGKRWQEAAGSVPVPPGY